MAPPEPPSKGDKKGAAGPSPPLPPRPQASVVARSASRLAASLRGPAGLTKKDGRPPAAPLPGPSRAALTSSLSGVAGARVSGEEGRVSAEPPVPGVPELNSYIRGKFPGPGFVELLRSLGDAKALEDKHHRTLLQTVFPRLGLFEVLPANMVAQLLQLTANTAEDKRLQRGAYYFLQVLLGAGSAGTPSPLPGPSTQSAAAELPKNVAGRAWDQLAGAPDLATTELQLRALAAAARGAEGKLDADLVAAIGSVVGHAASGASMPFAKKGAKKALSEPYDLQRIALSAARAGLRGKPMRELALGSSSGISSQDAVGAKHALTLFTAAARLEPAKAMEAAKGLPNLVSAAAAAYESSGFVLGSAGGPKGSPDKAKSPTGLPVQTLNIADPWARVALSRLCAALLYADWAGGTEEFCGGIGAPFWTMLTYLATREADDFVALEAIRALFGNLPVSGAGLHHDKPEAATEGRMRARAWRFVASRAGQEVVFIPGLQGPESGSLMGSVCARIRKGIKTLSSGPVLCSACRTAGAMAESRVRAGRAGGGSAPMQALTGVAEELFHLLDTATGAPIRCAALDALLWAQVAGVQTGVTPALVLRHVSTATMGRAGSDAEPWPADVLQALMTSLLRMLRAAPHAAPALLAVALAAAAAAPSHTKAEQMVELWNATMASGASGRSVALQSALQLLAAPPGPPGVPRIKGLGQQALARAAGDDAAWAALQRAAAWWLGEYVNLATGEAVGRMGEPGSPPDADARSDDGVDDDPGPCISAAETTALKGLRNPQLAAVTSHLQHAAASAGWPVRIAATQALAKIAVRSDEPYRLYCYSWLASHAARPTSPNPDALGVWATARAAVPLLDAMYSTRAMLDVLATRYGEEASRWPPSVLRQLRARHNDLVIRVRSSVCSLPEYTYILGMRSRILLESGVEGHETYEPPTPKKGGKGDDDAAKKRLAELLRAEAEAPGDSPFKLAPRPEGESDLDSSDDGAGEALTPSDSEWEGPSRQGSDIFGGGDPLARLQQQLDQRIEADALPLRGPSPWQQAAFDRDSDDEERIARQPSFAFAERDASPKHTRHSRRPSVADSVDFNAPATGGRVTVLHDFEAALPEELSVHAGEDVIIEAEADGWVQCVSRGGVRGLVPASYLGLEGATPAGTSTIVAEPSVDFLAMPDMLAALEATTPQGEERTWTTFNGADGAAGASALPRISTPAGGTPPSSGLTPTQSLRAGVTPRHSRGSSLETAIISEQPWPATVTFAFDAETEDELTVVPDEGVVVHAEIDGWYQVTRVSDGRRGLVPCSYLAPT